MQTDDRSRYETLFYCQKLEDGFLSGDGARALFIRSKLPLSDLTRIWKLSDVTRDNKLDVSEFSLAIYLIELKLCGYEIPKQLAPSLYENVKKDVVISRMTEKERQRLQKLFKHKDPNCQGYLEKEVVQPLMLATRLSPSALSKVWNIADLDRDGRLSLIEFCIAFHILKNCLSGVNLDGPVNPFLCFPDEERTISLCKDTLKIFDKNYLLGKKETKVENSFFASSIQEINDTDFDLLVQCMSPAVLTKVVRPQTVVDVNSNTCSNKENIKYSKTVVENGFDTVLISSQENTEQVSLTSDTIESQQIIKSELSVDLESVFELLDKEHGDDNPIYIPPRKVFEEKKEEPLEDAVILPVLTKRPYIGKELIFEDPVGCETIADVEFEVDLESILRATMKESDEERRLPIARVLPIYKTPPANVEPLVEKKTIKKDVDFNINSDLNLERSDDIKDVPFKSSGINTKVEKENTAADTVQNEKESCQKGQDFAEDSTRLNPGVKHGDFAQMKNTEELYKDDEIVDIVERKRMMMINLAEERKKLREKNINNETMDKVPHPCQLTKTGTEKKNNKENTYKIEQVTNGKDTLSEKDNSLIEKKEERLIEKVGYIETASNNKSVEGQMTQPTEFDSSNTKYDFKEQTNDEINDVEERNRREAEEKEKLLLERIKMLERKRKELLENKQREAKLKEVRYQQKTNDSISNDEIQQNKTKIHESTEKMKAVSSTRDNRNVMETKEEESPDVWTSTSGQVHRGSKLISEDELRRLALAAEEKRRKEAELQKRREAELREHEKRRREELAREEEEREAAKERKRHFLENLEKLKQRVFSEEAEKSTSKTKNERPKSMAGVVSQAMDTYMGPNQTENVKDNEDMMEKLNEREYTKTQTDNSFSSGKNNVEVSKEKQRGDLDQKEEFEREHGSREQNFKSNRELFTKKAGIPVESSGVVRRDKPSKTRPKSYYGGMFNKPVHKIIDDSLLIPDKYENLENSPDFVDEEALKQYKREQEFKKEHEKVISLRRSLERDTSYKVENVEIIWDNDINPQPQNNHTKSDSSHQKQTKPADNPNRRSLVNTLTTEWNSFIDILEEGNKRESETVKMRQEISQQDEQVHTGSHDPTKAKPPRVKNVEANSQVHSTLRRQEPLKDSDVNELDMKKQRQTRIIKDNAPKRKSDLAYAWSNIVSRQ